MKPLARSKVRRVMKWVGLSACLILALMWIFTWGRWGPGYRFGSGLHVGIGNGKVGSFTRIDDYKFGYCFSCFINPNDDMVVMTGPYSERGGRAVAVSLLKLSFLIAIPTYILWRRDRRHPPGHCQGCGYDLTGNESGMCPECGEAR